MYTYICYMCYYTLHSLYIFNICMLNKANTSHIIFSSSKIHNKILKQDIEKDKNPSNLNQFGDWQ